MPSNQVTTEVSIKLRKWPMPTLLIGWGSYPEVFFTWDLYPKKLVGIYRKMSNFNMDCSKFKGMANESCESIIVETWKRIIGKKITSNFEGAWLSTNDLGSEQISENLGRLFDFGSKTHCQEDAWNRQWNQTGVGRVVVWDFRIYQHLTDPGILQEGWILIEKKSIWRWKSLSSIL